MTPRPDPEMVFALTWREWGIRYLIENEDEYDQEQKRWLILGMRNLPKHRWHWGVLPPRKTEIDERYLVRMRQMRGEGIANPLPKRKRPRPRVIYAIEDWSEQDHDRSLHCDPRKLGIDDEPFLWWEPPDPDPWLMSQVTRTQDSHAVHPREWA